MAITLTATVMKFLPAFMRALKETKNGNGNGNHADKAGFRSVEEWKGIFKDLIHEGNEEQIADIRTLIEARSDKLRQMIREEIAAQRKR